MLCVRTHTASEDSFSIIPASGFGCAAVSQGDSRAMIQSPPGMHFTPVLTDVCSCPFPFIISLGSSRRLEKIKKSEGYNAGIIPRPCVLDEWKEKNVLNVAHFSQCLCLELPDSHTGYTVVNT